jgi:hypothetical protein
MKNIRIKSIRGFIRMKYEQHMVRKLSKLIDKFYSDDDLSWWPEYLIEKRRKEK